MGTLPIMLLLCRVASIAFGLRAAHHWFRASTVRVTDADKRYDPKVDFILNDPTIRRMILTSSRLQRSRAGSTESQRPIRRLLFSARRQYHSSSDREQR